MTVAPDGSRDRRIEDLSNLYLIHPAAQALVPRAIALGLSANAVSVIGLLVGTAAALADARWRHPGAAGLGLGLAILWLILDGLDGMVARATGTASAIGRVLDGLCDHGVFTLIYVGLALSMGPGGGTAGGWALAIAAGACHAVQSSLYEGERARFHRRMRGLPMPATASRVPVYDRVAQAFDRRSAAIEDALVRGGPAAARDYAERAAAPMKAMTLLSANVRVLAIFVACLAGRPSLFWWFEIGPLTLVAIVTMAWHRHVEARMAGGAIARRHAGSWN
jgi:phosphatidylserine synthase